MPFLRRVVIALALALLAPALLPAVQTPARVKLSFWNLEWFPGHKPEPSAAERAAHIAEIQPEIAKLKPDIMGFSEVEDWKAIEAATAKVPGMKVNVVGQFVDKAGKIIRQQTALASKLPCLGAWWEQWKVNEAGFSPRRGFAFAAYQPVPGKVLLVYALHLKSNRRPEKGEPPNERMREESMKQLMQHVTAMTTAYGRMGKVTVIIGGDLNTSLDDSRFAQEQTLRNLMHAGYTWPLAALAPRDRYTIPPHGRYPGTTFDHIFFLGPMHAVEVNVGETGPECSDHCSVSAILEWR